MSLNISEAFLVIVLICNENDISSSIIIPRYLIKVTRMIEE